MERLRRMRELLLPFGADGSGRGVQENVLTRDGDVEKALGRMRLLLVRVAGRLQGLDDVGEDEDEGEGEEEVVDVLGRQGAGLEDEWRKKVNGLVAGL